MGKGKESKNVGAKGKQNTNSAPNIEEKPMEEPPKFGDKKLQRQWEREQREAREIENLKRIAADKAKQESKKSNEKKKNKKSAVAQVSKVKDKVTMKMEHEITETASGLLDIKNNYDEKIEELNIKQENYNIPVETCPTRNTVKINRHFDYSSKHDLPTQSNYDNKKIINDIDNFEQDNQVSGNTNWINKNSSKNQSWNKSRNQFSHNFTNKGSFDRDSHRQNNSHAFLEQNDKEFQEFYYLASNRAEINYGKTNEIKGDLFSASQVYSLAHCVAEDMSMGAGIAKTFRAQFGRVGELLNQRARTGGLAYLDDNERFIYYLVTKKISRGKPTLYTLWQSLGKLKKHIQEKNVNKLAIPQIGCGLDRLDWRIVRQMLEYIFRDVDIEIVVYIWDESLEEAPKKMLRKCAVIHSQINLIDIESQTGLIYFGSVDGYETEEFRSLCTKFNIVAYKGAREITQVIKTVDKEEYIYGLIIKNSHEDDADFLLIEKCIKNLWTMLKKDETYYIGIQAFIDNNDELLLDKIIALMQYIFLGVDIWVCWPDNLRDMCPQTRKSYY